MTKLWHFLTPIRAPMPYQMAVDELIFRRVEHGLKIAGQSGSPYLRFYFSAGPWVTQGYSHRDEQAAEGKFLEVDPETGYPQCRRITGGGRVVHGRDLVMALMARKHDDESFSSVRVSYWKIHEAVKKGFELLGYEPSFYRCDEKLETGSDCFRYPISSDLRLKNQKLAGGAQKRSSGALLHQESIRLEKEADPFKVIEKIILGFEQVFDVKISPAFWDQTILNEAKHLSAGKYEQALSGHHD